VHFRTVHAFNERDRQVSDVLGRIAADLIETRRSTARAAAE
jgi:hypothetical protein